MSNLESYRAVDTPQIKSWLSQNIPDSKPPFDFDLVPDGQSNLTFIIADSNDKKWVLRRPPLHQVLATAHDMTREHTIISALHPTGFPVPEPIQLCTDSAISERPFFIMEYADGLIIKDIEAVKDMSLDLRRQSGINLAKTLAQLHSINPDEVGLNELAKKEDYISRQLNRWVKQVRQSKTPASENAGSGKTVPQEIEELYEQLVLHIPEQHYTGIVHGDYRLDNCVLHPKTGEVSAILDWELSTLGDTLADFGFLCVYWTGPEDKSPTFSSSSATTEEGFINRQDLIEAYQKASGRNLNNIDFYMAFAYWRLVCILQGVYSRYLDGAMPGKAPPGGVEILGDRIDILLEQAKSSCTRLGI